MKVLHSFVPSWGLRHAFSLVETVLALAVVAVSLLTLVGLMPGGLEDLRRSGASQAEARIIQSVMSGYQMNSWGSPGSSMALPDKDFYFDMRGMPVTRNHRDHAITARAVVDAVNPTLAGDATPSPHLRRLRIRITQALQAEDAFTNSRLHVERSVLVANLEQTKFY